MKNQPLKSVCLIILFFVANAVVSQNRFKEGYYLNNAGDKITGYIKNVDWKNSPSNIDFRTSPEGDTKTIGLSQMSGFGIHGQVAYVKKTFDLDVKSERLNSLNLSKEPEFESRTALLEVLVEGSATLYYYENQGAKKFFYSIGNDKPEALVFVRYLVGTNVASNDRYKQQLANALVGCASLNFSDFESLNYKQNSLTKLFKQYNLCKDPNYVATSNKKTPTKLNLNLFAGFNASSVEVTTAMTRSGGDFGNQTNLRFGGEFELLLPFNNNAFGIYLGLAKNSNFESTIVQELSSTTTPSQDVTLTYSTVNLPFGIRYYIPLNENTKFLLDGGYHIDLISELSIDREVTANDFNSENGSYGFLALGAGVQYKQFFVRANVDIGKDPFSASTFGFESDVSSFNLVVGYQIPLVGE